MLIMTSGNTQKLSNDQIYQLLENSLKKPNGNAKLRTCVRKGTLKKNEGGGVNEFVTLDGM